MFENLWIGLIKIKPINKSSVIGECEGAYTNFISKSRNRNLVTEQLEISLNSLGLKLIKIENFEKFNRRINKFNVNKELTDLAHIVENDGILRFGTFHIY